MLIQQEDVYSNFIDSIKSDVTKKIYGYNLRLFMEFCGIDKYDNLIGQQNRIVEYLMALRKKKLSYNSICTRLNAIYHFYDMNDISLNKKKIKMFKGEYSRKIVDRAYTHDDIKKTLDVSDLRSKVIVLLISTTGMRIGALPSIRLGSIEKMDSIYRITVYEGSNSQYDTFCSPECASFIDAYLEFRKRNGENLQDKSFLVRDQFDITDLEQIRNRSKGISVNGIGAVLNMVLVKAGVRTIDHSSRNRKQIARAHGFRKFFTTQCINAKINPEIREMLLGHKIGLASCYYRPTEDEMYQEYLKAVELLTINEESRLKRKVEILEIEKSRIERLEHSIKKLEEKYHQK